MITKSIGVYGNDYLQRATINLIGLGANPYEQAIYLLNITDKYGHVPQGDTNTLSISQKSSFLM